MNRERLLTQFLRFVQIDTTAVDGATRYPSSPGQLELGKLLVDDLLAMGIRDAIQDEHGIVMATIPSTRDRVVPTIVFNAHLDTSPETTGAGVRPQVIEAYAGGDIVLPADQSQVIRVSENPALEQLIGRTLITTDGTTLLGGDDKAGVAVIMELAALLCENPELPHGPVRILFTCDEEIGHGVDHVDLQRVAATAGYTLDGGGANDLDVETFSADVAVVRVQGVNIHPSIGKDRMVNAVRAAAEFVHRLPRDELAPECTDGREGFLHPYVVEGGVAEVTMRILLRDFDTVQLSNQADLLRRAAAAVEREIEGVQIAIDVQHQYRNMAEGLDSEPRAVQFAAEAHRRLGREPRLSIIRGGTDGSLLTALGLPTPNLSSGQHNPHSPLEWACLDEMCGAVEVITELTRIWAEVEPE